MSLVLANLLMRLVLSTLTDPFLNLALENVLFQRLNPLSPQIVVYFNTPCIVIGRNQNPWKECNLQSEIPILRRRSGGGAVVHDLQTANFSLQTSKQQFYRTSLLNYLVTATKAYQPLQINERYDLTLFGDKVSGSAYKIEKERAYHHATLLLNSNLTRLSRALKPSDYQPTVIESLGTDSVKSKVRNVEISKQKILKALETQFKTSFELINETDSDVLQEAQELKSWDWRFGKTPKFTALLNNDPYLVKNGRIAEGPKFIGQKFPLSTW